MAKAVQQRSLLSPQWLALPVYTLLLIGCQTNPNTFGTHNAFSISAKQAKEHLTVQHNKGNLWEVVRSGMTLDIPLNARVTDEIAWYQNQPYVLAKMQRNAKNHLYLITSEIKRRHMPMEIALVPAVESLYQTHVTSPTGAAGMWQFVPGTGRVYGLKQNSVIDYRRNPLQSTKAALNYLSYLHKYFDNDWELALAAYNAGEGNIQQAIALNQRRGLPTDFWALQLRPETMRYVPKIYALAELIRNSHKYRITLHPISAKPALAEVSVNKSIDLNEAARKCNLDSNNFRRLNAAYLKQVTLAGRASCRERKEHLSALRRFCQI